jgi:lipopolysaccharide biosynthesis regulator YciM
MLSPRTPRICLACLLILTALPLFAQRGRSVPGGRAPSASQLTVRVVGMDDHRIGSQFQVQLLNGGGVPIQMGFADSTGTARFGNIGSGSYRLRVTGAAIEEANTDFEIMPGESFHTETVRVKPLAQPSAHTASTGKPATVSAADLQAPDKAKKELAKGNDAVAHDDMKKAMDHYRKAIDDYPRYVAALNNLGVVCMQVNDLACGRESFEKAIQIDPNLARAYLNLARLTLRERQFVPAEALLVKAVAIEPLNPEALTMLSISELLQGKLDDAIANARKVHTVDHAGWGLAHLIAAQALEAKKLPGEAIAEYDLFVKEAPDNPNVPKARDAMARLAPLAGQQH